MTTTAASRLDRIWASRRGLLGVLTAVNHKQIGMRFIWTAGVFLLIGGIEALLLRLQLAGPDGQVLGPDAYNALFTMHGTTMMFLFAVPMLEGLAMYLVPLQIGTRDMPFPRLNAFGYWTYLFGGIFLHVSFLTGHIPDGGWFAYTPLTGPEFSSGLGIDFWLLGVTFVEVSGILGALEIIVVVLRFRAAGMSLSRLPLFSWAAFVMAGMILVAFPFVLTASVLLEVERKFGAPFYDPTGGGDPLLWQHLFWIFGHPEVYIMLIPAIGIVSAVVSVHVRRPIVAYGLVVASTVAIAVASFGLWVHHMFTVGLPVLALSLFAVASYFIAIPSGIQVFAWIATIWEGRPRWTTPMWFVVGFLFIFVLGGVTGVMVATAPFDAQAHDSFFVVAHFHYVLIGGVVFPIFAGLHHWLPKFSGRMPSERAGKAGFWLMFLGFNLTFFPQHWLGLQGMVRRTYTYPAELGWGGANLASTVGAFVLAAGILVFLANLLTNWRWGRPTGGDPWEGDTLEWAAESPPENHNFTSLPVVAGRSPLWDVEEEPPFEPEVLEAVDALSDPPPGLREVIRTSVVEGTPESVEFLPGPSYWPFSTALGLALALTGVLVDSAVLALLGGLVTAVCTVGWATGTRPRVEGAAELEVERGWVDARFARLGPVGRPGSFWGTNVGLVAVATVVGALVYAYGYLRLGFAEWPPAETGLRPLAGPGAALALVLVAAVLSVRSTVAFRVPALVFGGAAFVAQMLALAGSGHSIDANAYEAAVVVLDVTAAALLGSGLVAGVAARWASSRLDQQAFGAELAWWRGVLFLWVLLWLVIHLGGRVL